jgi:hypothetical protein
LIWVGFKKIIAVLPRRPGRISGRSFNPKKEVQLSWHSGFVECLYGGIEVALAGNSGEAHRKGKYELDFLADFQTLSGTCVWRPVLLTSIATLRRS